MKRITLALIITLSIVYLSCKKTGDGIGEVYGTWKLTETLADPGDGSGKYMKVKGDSKYLVLNKSGSIEGDAIPDLLTFKIIDSVKMEVTSKNQTRPFTYYYKATAKTLTLNPPCIEGCGLRFIRK
ncbi:hypothetical protein [Pedobacter mucosus]|uniref:hypothetical protein n=1 Tax=Pedobacter mucosus TaxID=2895286 RepID=UPI001EE3D9C3|nr:hypothetical protein [Pedobacter mucosus]UKT62682.1 hypothetical protein LOK61_13020 [Pedobacter mucosus]